MIDAHELLWFLAAALPGVLFGVVAYRKARKADEAAAPILNGEDDGSN